MSTLFTQFAAASADGEKTDILTGLGIDWTILIVQLIAFLILTGVLAKYVYPVFMRIIDERQEKLDDAGKAAEQAEKKAEQAEAKIADSLKQARSEAAEIVATAKDEATQMIEKAENQAKSRSERIVAEAREDIEKDVLAARKALKSETAGLVKQAAGLAVAGIASDKLDAELIKKSIEGAKR